MAMFRTPILSLFTGNLSPAGVCGRLLCPAVPVTTHQHRDYAKPMAGLGGKKGKAGPKMQKVRLPVESDPEKLVKYVCGSHPVKEERQDVMLKDDSEYPEWLWTLRTGKPPPLRDLDPNTREYWKRLRILAMKEKNKLRSLKRF